MGLDQNAPLSVCFVCLVCLYALREITSQLTALVMLGQSVLLTTLFFLGKLD